MTDQPPRRSGRLDDPALVDDIVSSAVARVAGPPEVEEAIEAPVEDPAPPVVPTAAVAPPPPDEVPPSDGVVPEPGAHPYRGLIEWAFVIGGALVVAILVKTFLFQAFFIPSSSMEPTLEPGDRVIVNKISYDLHDVHRGDLVVFERVDDAGAVEDLIKRVIGLPNETVEVRSNVVYIDGQPLDEPYLAEGAEFGDTAPVVVPDDAVFVMGDNRSDSLDSRVFGPIGVDQIVGRASLRVWPPSGIGFL